jgi:hypothetical protein
MKKWQPPIPAGALCSPEAIGINFALPLLGWCYDEVDTDGWLPLNLHAVAGEIDVPYHTVKKWWTALRGSKFVAEVEELGRKGMRIRLADEAIDWRILEARETGPSTVPNTERRGENGTRIAPPTVPNDPNRDRNGTETRPSTAPKPNANKVLISDQKECVSEDRDGTERADTHAPALTIFREHFPQEQLDAKQIKVLCSTATDLAVWRSVVELFDINGWLPLLGNMLDRYRKTLKEQGHQRNGQHKPARAPVDMPITVADPARKPLPLAERQRILKEIKLNDTS